MDDDDFDLLGDLTNSPGVDVRPRQQPLGPPPAGQGPTAAAGLGNQLLAYLQRTGALKPEVFETDEHGHSRLHEGAVPVQVS